SVLMLSIIAAVHAPAYAQTELTPRASGDSSAPRTEPAKRSDASRDTAPVNGRDVAPVGAMDGAAAPGPDWLDLFADLSDALITRVYDLVIERHPEGGWAYRERGIVALRQNDPQRALGDLNKAVALSPRDALAYLARAGAYLCRREYDHALSD